MRYTKRTKGRWIFPKIIMNTYFQFITFHLSNAATPKI